MWFRTPSRCARLSDSRAYATLGAGAILALLPCLAATAAPDGSPDALYRRFCAQCHDAGVPRAPHPVEFPILGSRTIYKALASGLMRQQAEALSDAQQRALAEYLGGTALAAATTAAGPRCTGPANAFDFSRPPLLDGWSLSPRGDRFVPAAVARLPVAQAARLRLAWTFAFPGAARVRSQPSIAGGAIYVGSQDGTVYALDLLTGCTRWTFEADSEVRSAISLDPWRAGDRTARPRAYFGDTAGMVYAVDAQTGRLLWKTRPHPHPRATLTGSPRLYNGRLYVPISSSEWASAGNPRYECCSFRGAVAALDAATGAVRWLAYAIAQVPRPTSRPGAAGTRQWGPAGAPIWNTPTIDARRHRLYVGTGQAYTSPAADTTDAVLAIDLDSGAIAWSHQSLRGDAWNLGCMLGTQSNCPREHGPDLDIGAPPILHTLPDGRDVLLVGQKSGEVFSLDPDAAGRLLWKVKIARGGLGGGVHWGMAASDDTLFVPVSDLIVTGTEPGEAKPGLFALDPSSGALKWFVPAPNACSAELTPACDPGYSPPPTALPGLVFQPSFDGWLRLYAADSGTLLWQFNTAREFQTVSGETGHGGSIDASGAVVYDGSLVVGSGYGYFNRMAGNLLLVFRAADGAPPAAPAVH